MVASCNCNKKRKKRGQKNYLGNQLEDAVYVESKSDGNVVFKKRKASKKLKSPRFVFSSNF